MKLQNSLTVIFFSFILYGCATAPSVERERYVDRQSLNDLKSDFPKVAVVLNKTGVAPFYGVLEKESGESSGAIFYSGDAGFAGLLAQIVAHAAIENDAQNREMSEAQKSSNKILEAYNQHISKNTYEYLLESFFDAEFALSDVELTLIDQEKIGASGFVIDSSPVYYLSQNEETIIVENYVRAFYSDSPHTTVFENISKVIVSRSVSESWLDNDGVLFAQALADIYKESFGLILQDMYGVLDGGGEHSTHKYYEGGNRKYIRGSLISSTCKYTVVKDLKNNIIAFPSLMELDGCASAG